MLGGARPEGRGPGREARFELLEDNKVWYYIESGLKHEVLLDRG
jgi:hypothetical protein